MSATEATILPIIFIVLFGMMIINFFANLSLYFFTRIQGVRLLCWYWASLIMTYLFIGNFQTGELEIALSFSANVIPLTILAKIFLDSMQIQLPIKKYLMVWLVGVITVPALYFSGFEFTSMTLPLTLAVSYPIIEAALYALVTKRQQTTYLQKFIATQYLIGALHVVNFALFRMVPGTQLWGWAVAIAFYQVMSISLFAFALEEYAKDEKRRLLNLVNEKTQELANTLTVKDTLFKMVLHDIANPLTGQLWIIKKLQDKKTQPMELINHLARLTEIIRNVIQQVRSIEMMKSGKAMLDITPVVLQECLDDIKIVFKHQLKNKNINLVIEDDLRPGTMFLADRNSFTTSVLGNLISNAIKFSPPNSLLKVHAFERDEQVMIELEDRGIGMTKELTYQIFDPAIKTSRPGTLGEKGTGFGMPLVKSYVEHFGGSIDVESRSQELYPEDHGTKITLKLSARQPSAVSAHAPLS